MFPRASLDRGAALLAALLAASALAASVTAVRAQSWGPDYGSPPKGSQWVKLCDGAAAGTVPACRLLHERLDTATGSNTLKIELRDVVGTASEKTLVVSLKPSFRSADGVQILLYTAEQWAKLKNKEPVPTGELRKLRISPMACSATECVARSKIGGRVWEQWTTFAGMVLYALDLNGRPSGFTISLEGFAATTAGGAVDPRAYARARDRLIKQGGTGGAGSSPSERSEKQPTPAPPAPPTSPAKGRTKSGVDA